MHMIGVSLIQRWISYSHPLDDHCYHQYNPVTDQIAPTNSVNVTYSIVRWIVYDNQSLYDGESDRLMLL